MIKLAKIFSSGCVLQHGRKINFWGNAQPGSIIRIVFQTKTFELKADEHGSFKGKIGPFSLCSGESMTITEFHADDEAQIDKTEIHDVAAGEVWLAGGQSNMEFYLKFEKHFQNELKYLQEHPQPQIRNFEVPKLSYDGQENDFDFSQTGIWLKADADNAPRFSAVGYYFAREINAAYNVPVGIINCTYAGSPACAWMSEDSVLEYGHIWEDEFRSALKDRTLDEFIRQSVRNNPIFDKGRYAEDPFSEKVLPVTINPHDLSFKQNLPIDWENNKKGEILTHKPGVFYEHMLKTIAPYTIKGMLYYQGESDDGEGKSEIYDAMLKSVIGDWRMLWKEALPFIYVQLPGFKKWLDIENYNFALIRQLQENVLYETPGTYMVSISDSGEEFDIHPKDKQVVGYRLALMARRYAYGEQIQCDAPFQDEYIIDGPYIRVHFKMAEGGLTLDKGVDLPIHVYLDEKEKEEQWTARVMGEELLIKVENEMALAQAGILRIKFARDKYYKVELKNKAGIPALPFEIAERL